MRYEASRIQEQRMAAGRTHLATQDYIPDYIRPPHNVCRQYDDLEMEETRPYLSQILTRIIIRTLKSKSVM